MSHRPYIKNYLYVAYLTRALMIREVIRRNTDAKAEQQRRDNQAALAHAIDLIYWQEVCSQILFVHLTITFSYSLRIMHLQSVIQSRASKRGQHLWSNSRHQLAPSLDCLGTLRGILRSTVFQACTGSLAISVMCSVSRRTPFCSSDGLGSRLAGASTMPSTKLGIGCVPPLVFSHPFRSRSYIHLSPHAL